MEFVRKSAPGAEVLQETDCMNGDGSVLPLLQFPKLAQLTGIRHGFTTRMGGVSGGDLGALNLSFSRGDDPANVRENFRRVAEVFGTTCGHFVLTRQVHGTNVVRAKRSDAGAGVTGPLPWESADGLITNVPGLLLGCFAADCVPILFADPVHRAVGASHSGWRGTVKRMGAVTLQRMKEEFGTNPADVFCGIGPSICRDHYEVSDDVADAFRTEFPLQQEAIVQDLHNGHALLDLWEACRVTLVEAGVRPENIEVTDICTACNPDRLFSHRASHGRRGNIGGFIMLTEDLKFE